MFVTHFQFLDHYNYGLKVIHGVNPTDLYHELPLIHNYNGNEVENV